MSMGIDPNGMDRQNQFALVIYIPDPLGRFLDDLRRELAPDCVPHAHVSVLPPRPISAPWQQVREEAQARAGEFEPFEIEAGEIGIFPVTDVIYIELARGGEVLRRMHAALSEPHMRFDEPFPYHPHITLGQELPREHVAETLQAAIRRWHEYRGPRTFRADKAAFVKNASVNRWIDLAELSLGAVPVS